MNEYANRVSIRMARDIDAHNAAVVTVTNPITDETHQYDAHTDRHGEGLWIDGKQTEGTCQFSVGLRATRRQVYDSYRRYFQRVWAC